MAVADFNSRDLSFVVDLGDITDRAVPADFAPIQLDVTSPAARITARPAGGAEPLHVVGIRPERVVRGVDGAAVCLDADPATELRESWTLRLAGNIETDIEFTVFAVQAKSVALGNIATVATVLPSLQ